MRRLKLLPYLIPLVILSLPLGCGNTLYVVKLGWHQASLACHSVPSRMFWRARLLIHR